jgi:hypothetical protein
MATYPLNPGDIVELSMRFTLFNQRLLTVLHFQANLGAPIADGIAALNTAAAQWVGVGGANTQFLGLITGETTEDAVRMQVVYPVRRPYNETPVGNAGLYIGTCTAPNVAVVCTAVSLTAGRGKNGSFHVGGVPTAAYSGGLVTGPYINLVKTFASRSMDPLGVGGAGNNLNRVIWSKAKPTAASQILSNIVQGTIRVMRRRTVGVGI